MMVDRRWGRREQEAIYCLMDLVSVLQNEKNSRNGWW